MTEWYEELFDERYVGFYDGLDRARTAESDVDFIERALDLQEGMRVLDLGCGQGRHAIPLAERGYDVTGVDLSPTMLERARRFAKEREVAVRWHRRRMENLDGLGPFDACLCLYTVLGYYGDDGDLDVLHQVCRSLHPGGLLMLDLTNFAGYLRRLPNTIWREAPDSVNREINYFEPLTGWIVSERSRFLKAGGVVALPTSRVRAYLPHEIRRMLFEAGFEPELLFGEYADTPFVWESSEHQIHVARRAD
ncbi:MAG: methyltransferase domain-containing protein [bacterium]